MAAVPKSSAAPTLPVSPRRAWLLAVRLRTLPAAVAPVWVGSALAAANGEVHLWRALVAIACALLIQIGTNLHNDYADHRSGADSAARLGPPRATQRGWLQPRQVAQGAAWAFAAACVGGASLVWVGGWPVVGIGLVSIAAGYAYTGGPYPLAYHGLGEAFVFAFFGLVAVAGTFYVQTLRWPIPAAGWWAGACLGALCSAILVVNNLRDRHTDGPAGKRTLAVIFGAPASRALYASLVLGAYAVPVGLVATGQVGPGWLLPLVSLGFAARLIGRVVAGRAVALNPLLGATARLELGFALLLGAGILW